MPCARIAWPMLVRPARESDVPAILAVYNEAVLTTTATYDYEPQPFEARLAWFHDRQQRGLPVLVAEEAGAVLGWAALNPHREKPGYLRTVENSVYIAEKARGRGVGRMLLAALVQEARRLHLHVILAGVDAENEASLRLHQRFGFVEAGRFRQVGWKFGRWLDVVYLQLTLPASEGSPADTPDPRTA